MQPFTKLKGAVAPLPRVNVDTDQIIPKQFLKRIERTGFGEHAFEDWRYLPDGSPDPAFELNEPGYEGATILVAGRNFGCGSSREHAPQSLRRWGIRGIAHCLGCSGAEVTGALVALYDAGLVARGADRDGQARWWALELEHGDPMHG